MNFDYNKVIPIKGDASFRKFYRKKIKKKSSIIVFAEKEKIKNLLNYDSINQLLLKKMFLHQGFYRKILIRISLKLKILEKKHYLIF